MVGESLDFSHQGDGIPEDLFSEWLLMGPVPKGKRCMAVTFTNTRVNRRGRGEWGERAVPRLYDETTLTIARGNY